MEFNSMHCAQVRSYLIHLFIRSFIHSFIHSFDLHIIALLQDNLLRGAPIPTPAIKKCSYAFKWYKQPLARRPHSDINSRWSVNHCNITTLCLEANEDFCWGNETPAILDWAIYVCNRQTQTGMLNAMPWKPGRQWRLWSTSQT